MLLRHLHIFRHDLDAVGQHQQRDMVGEQLVQALLPLGLGQALEGIILRLADDLDLVAVKILIKAGERQGRPGHGPGLDQDILIILRSADHLQMQLADDLMQRHRIFRHRLLLRIKGIMIYYGLYAFPAV